MDFFESPFVSAAELRSRIPNDHVRTRPTELEAGVPSEVLVRKEKDLVGAGSFSSGASGVEGPFEDPSRIGGRADRPTVSTYERLECRRRVHVGDRHHALDVCHLGDGLPGLFHRFDVGHVGHRAPCVQVGEEHLLAAEVSTSADSAMKWTPQKTTNSASWVAAAIRERPKESPRASAQRMTSSRW